MSVLQGVMTMAYLIITIFALLGAIDFIMDSLAIFKAALRKRGERDDL
jgi:hypothetical protein